MKVVVFGASGKVGRLVVDELVRRGHEVTAFVHTHPVSDNIRNVRGDIYDRASVEAAIAGQEAIVSTLGSWGTKDKNILSTAMQKIVPAAEAASIRRLVSLTGDGAQAKGDDITLAKRVSHPLFNLVAPKVLRDGEDHIAILGGSNLNYTVLRSPVMTGHNRGAYTLSDKSASLLIPRATVAYALADLAESDDWRRSSPFIRRG